MLTDIQRDRMVASQVEARGVTDPLVLKAMRAVPREAFVPAALACLAYEDGALAIGHGRTMSPPYVVAVMAAAADVAPGARVLEIGTGSGYGAAVLSRIAAEVCTVERVGALADEARRRLAALGYDNIHVVHGDGSLGCPEHARYDAIVVTVGGPRVPKTLLHQIAVGGRLVMPIGSPGGERLVRVVRTEEHEYEYTDLEQVVRVPLAGTECWSPDGAVLASTM